MPSRRYLPPDTPFVLKALKAVNIALYYLFAFPPVLVLTDIALTFVVAVVVTSPVRNDVDQLWFSILLIGFVFTAVNIAGAKVFPTLLPKLGRLIDGPPTFGDLGGLQKHILRTTVLCSRELRLVLDPADTEIMNRLAALDRDMTEATMKEKFLELEERETPSESDDTREARWKSIWEREILGYQAGGATLGDAFFGPSWAIASIPMRLVGVRSFLVPAFKFIQLVLLILIFRVIAESGSVLTVLQVGIALSFLMSMLIYLNYSKAFGRITIQDWFAEADALPPEVRDRYFEWAEQDAGQEVVPVTVSITDRYFAPVSRFFARNIAVFGAVNTLIAWAVSGLALAIGLVVAWGSRGELVEWYGKFALGIALIPIGMLALHYFASVLVEHVRSLAAIVLGGLVTGLLPIGIQYVVSGDISGETLPVVSSVLVGIAGAVAAAVGTALSNRVGRQPAAISSGASP